MDVVLVGLVGLLVAGGWRTGFVRRVFGLAFLAVAFVAGAYLRYPVGALATSFFKDIPPDYANLVGYSIAFPVTLGALNLASGVVIRRLPASGLSRGLDRALGAAFGGVEAILIISAVVVIADAYFGTGSTVRRIGQFGVLASLTEALNASTTVHLLRDSTIPVVLAILGPLLPKDVTTLIPGGIPGLPGGFPLPGGLPLPTP